MTMPETPSASPYVGRSSSGRFPWMVAVCSWLSVAIVVSAWAAIHAGDVWWPGTVLLFGPRWLLALPLIPLVLAATLWRRRSLPVLAMALLLLLGPLMGFNIPWRGDVPAGPPRLRMRVLTCNIHYKRPLKRSLQRLLDDADPDVVAVQELPGEVPIDYFTGEGWHVRREGRLLFASRYPIGQANSLGTQSMQLPGLIMRYELDTPGGAIVLYSLHLASPREGLYDTTHHPESGNVELEDNSVVRFRQSESLAHIVERETKPVLLMGDFNTPPESAIFRRVWDRYHDAFTEAGWGWGYTFLGGRTAVRIDHILAGPDWYCERCWVGPFIGSPHRPVLADLLLAEPRP
jgi:vancomycin resistance protein VanJ